MISVEEFGKRMDGIIMDHFTRHVPRADQEIMCRGVKECENILRDTRRRMPWDKTPVEEAEDHAEKVLLDVLKSEYRCRLAISRYLLNQD